jgi:hypothetical protein
VWTACVDLENSSCKPRYPDRPLALGFLAEELVELRAPTRNTIEDM